MKLPDFGKWLAIGTAAGIEIGRENLTATVVRLRPTGARILDQLTIPGFREQAASEWGATAMPRIPHAAVSLVMRLQDCPP